MIYIGIDPGIDGAVAVTGDGWTHIDFTDTPNIADGTKRRPDAAGMAAILRELKSSLEAERLFAVIERVHSMPKQGVASSFTFGVGYGIWLGILAALEIPFIDVTPQCWKKALMEGRDKDKGASIIVAKQLFPFAAAQLARKKDHGRADAALLMEYGRRTRKI